jgi:hypothetical protein
MALSDNTKIDKSFRALINKEFTTTSKKFFEEFGANTINMSMGEVWSSTISSTPATAVTDGVAELYTDFTLSPLVGFTNSVFYFASGSGFTPGTTINRGTIDENLLQRNFISDKYGSAYTAILKDANGTQVFPTDNIDWIFDYQTGILSIQDPGGGYTTPYKLTVYQYVGNFGGGSGNPDTPNDSIQFNSAGSFGGSARLIFKEPSGLTQLSGSLQITGSSASDFFLVKSASLESFKINNDGVVVLGDFSSTPTVQNGGIMYSSSNLWIGSQ